MAIAGAEAAPRRGTGRGTSSLLELDPELGQLVPEERLDAARAELAVRLHTLAAGEWDAARLAGADPEHVGLLLLDGVLAREVVVSDTVSVELLGPGDVIRPWHLNEDTSLLQLTVRWMVLAPSRLAVLDRRFAAAVVRYPEVNAVLIDRLNERASRLAIAQAISQLNRVDRRLLSLFWHLAERWGRVVPEGIAVPLVLPHRLLAQLVGARRPTVSTALGELARSGELLRRGDGTWLLTGEPVGMPTAEAARIVRQRRALIPAAAAEPDPMPAPPALGPEPAARRPQSELAQMRTSLDSIMADAAAHSQALEAITAETLVLRQRSEELRARRRVLSDRGERQGREPTLSPS